MSLIWRLLLNRFFKVFGLTIGAFIVFLIVFQLEELAEFAASGIHLSSVLKFGILQIPYILPVAIPVSALLAGVLTLKGLSEKEELAALRASGLSLLKIFQPFFLLGINLSLMNLLLTSEIATRAHLKSRELIFEITASNPLFLLENDRISHFQKGYLSIEGIKRGEKAKNLVISEISPQSNRLGLFIAKNLELKKRKFLISEASLLFPMADGGLYLENIEKSEGLSEEWASLFRPQSFRLSMDHLPGRLLFLEMKQLKSGKAYNKCKSEIARRLSLALAPFAFLLGGCAFGISFGRERKLRPYLILGLIITLSLISFFMAKGLETQFFLATLLYFLPHLLLIALSLFRITTIERGVDALI